VHEEKHPDAFGWIHISLRRKELQLSNLRRTPKAWRNNQEQLEKVNYNDNDQHGQRNTNGRKHSTTSNA
jgi:hypothetical protein